ncbi:MAG: hypothetical protein ACK59C_03465 [Holosporales bacterium]|jgi:hypothetical protein
MNNLDTYISIIAGAELKWNPNGNLIATYMDIHNHQATCEIPKETLESIKKLGMTSAKQEQPQLNTALKNIETKEKPFNILRDMILQNVKLKFDRNDKTIKAGSHIIPMKILSPMLQQKSDKNSPVGIVQQAIQQAIRQAIEEGTKTTTTQTPASVSQPPSMQPHSSIPTNNSALFQDRGKTRRTSREQKKISLPPINSETIVTGVAILIGVFGGMYLLNMIREDAAEQQAREKQLQEEATKSAERVVDQQITRSKANAIAEIREIQKNPQGEKALELILQQKIDTLRQGQPLYFPSNTAFIDPPPVITNNIEIPDQSQRCLSSLVQSPLTAKPGEIVQTTGRSISGTIQGHSSVSITVPADATVQSNAFFRTNKPKKGGLSANASFLADTTMEDSDYKEHYEKQGIYTKNDLTFQEGNFHKAIIPVTGSNLCREDTDLTSEEREDTRIVPLRYNLETHKRILILGTPNTNGNQNFDIVGEIANTTKAKTKLTEDIIRHNGVLSNYGLALVCPASQTTQAILSGTTPEAIIQMCTSFMEIRTPTK